MALPGGLAITTLFGGAMLLIGGLVLAVSGRYIWRATAVLRATELETLDDVPANTLVRVTGAITAGEEGTLVAPFSDVDCVALRYQIEERRLSVLYLLPWYVTVHEATAAVPFTVRTGAGTVEVVEPVRTVALTSQVVETTAATDDPPAQIDTFERDHDEIPTTTRWQDPPALLAPLAGLLSLGTRRYSEQRAPIDADVTVVGRVTPDGTGLDPLVVSDRSPTATVGRMAKTSIAGVLIGVCGLLLGVGLLVLL
ncbi:hypothetical protein BV210_18140 (plasmid) [Halorientalis sp. IM1011]|uniref:hypothetical protein n=1 Tax=Halorientalis sp. IM1011 TaxID=1932360 RepID=UPI00097CD58E|nr:hypothetical protein [Halorientalis sp. IM1011]AQL44679.1 hypothetical protein BV210_18140 [Halorientalis sp. IM1011]